MKPVWISLLVSVYICSALTAQEVPEGPNVYFISGLGADKRVFQKLELDPRWNIIHLNWIKPKLNESISNYARRLSAQIDTTQPFQIVGMSFGGTVAQEMSAFIRPQQIILVSSQSTGTPMNGFNRGLISFLLASPLAGPVLKNPLKITYRLFGAHTEEEKQMLKAILKGTNTRFMKWALRRLTGWKRSERVAGSYQIHGTADQLVKAKYVTPDHWIEGGEHLMIFSRAAEISPLLNRQLQAGTGL